MAPRVIHTAQALVERGQRMQELVVHQLDDLLRRELDFQLALGHQRKAIGGRRRRTLTLRFFGEEAVYDARQGGAGPPIKGFHQRMTTGAPFRDESFLQLRG